MRCPFLRFGVSVYTTQNYFIGLFEQKPSGVLNKAKINDFSRLH